jgi:hypothetical protein
MRVERADPTRREQPLTLPRRGQQPAATLNVSSMHHHTSKIVCVLLGFAVLAGCGSSGTRQGRPITLERMPAQAVATCRRSPFVRPACPTIVPTTVHGGRQVTFARLVWGEKVFELGSGAETPGHPELDHPPEFVHLVVAGGDLDRMFPFRIPPPEPAVAIRNGLRGKPRASPLSLGRFAWGCRTGRLFLAPSPTMNGGIVGDHLVYWWRTRQSEYAVTLHAWEPFEETVAVLRRIVRSVPSKC